MPEGAFWNEPEGNLIYMYLVTVTFEMLTLCTKSEVICAIKNKVKGQVSLIIFFCAVRGNGLVGILLPTNMAAAI